ncbi:FG-GAP repeat domain-containing protein [Streptomyces physcomitrii]|uniref:FG-GAP repeat domain-containing protein n=1 Tax=Streptomyces physcomitrii TaxID=2724184 RepID=UPI0028B053BD|nr:VCBS repeat-containing protein [Streptomyces physcomitrii]
MRTAGPAALRRHRRVLGLLTGALLALTAGLAPAQAATPSPDGSGGRHKSNAELLAEEACSVPADHDPAIIVVVQRVARSYDANAKVTLAAFEAGWVESHMHNLPCGDKDSLGVYQQRPSYGWGTPEQILDPVYAATQFITRAIDSDRRNPGFTAGQLAQSVQRSAFPDRYDQSEGKARAMMAEASRLAGMWGGSPTDFDGDGKDDVVTFTQNAAADVYAARSTGTAFSGTTVKWNDFFGLGGETPTTGDFNGDGKDDVVTFTHGSLADVYVGLSNGSSFGGGAKWHDFFAPRHEVTAAGDFNGDGKDDIVAFTHDAAGDAFVALSNGSSFGAGVKWHDFLAPNGEFPAVADVNGDGKDDIVVFTQGTRGDVFVSLSTGSGFGPAQLAHEFFAPGAEQPRVGDVNGDGKDDLVTFTSNADRDVYVALSNGSTFGPGVKWNDSFAPAGEFPYVGDFDGDGKADIVTFTKNASADVYVGLSTGSSFGAGAKWHDLFGLPGETAL